MLEKRNAVLFAVPVPVAAAIRVLHTINYTFN